MDYKKIILGSINTSMKLKLFGSKEESTEAHLNKSILTKISFNSSKFKNMDNFNRDRLKTSACQAFPLNNRPRGLEDIRSVKYFQKILENQDLLPIWIVEKSGQYILLDGVHRIVASYIEKKTYIYAYVIKIQ